MELCSTRITGTGFHFTGNHPLGTVASVEQRRLHARVYVEIQGTSGAEPRREIILTPSHIRLGRRLRINKDFPSRASIRTGEYFKHPHHPSRAPPRPAIVALHLFALLLSRREKHFLSTAPAPPGSDTACKLFLPFSLQALSVARPPRLLLFPCPRPFFPLAPSQLAFPPARCTGMNT